MKTLLKLHNKIPTRYNNNNNDHDSDNDIDTDNDDDDDDDDDDVDDNDNETFYVALIQTCSKRFTKVNWHLKQKLQSTNCGKTFGFSV